MRAGYFWWLQQKRCNELLHLWGMILPLCHRSFQFSPALAGVLLYKMNVATFQFSFLREERSPRKDMITQGNSYFNSRSLRGERWLLFQEVLLSAQFQFSLPVWGAIDSRCQLVQQGSISILAPCLGSDISEFLLQVLQLISILAPRVGSDIIDQLNLFEHRNFNSRPLRGERSERWYLCAASLQFQFSLLAWGAI